jgi:hypothetical protein
MVFQPLSSSGALAAWRLSLSDRSTSVTIALSEPYEDRGKVDHGKEVGGELLEAHGNAAVALDALKEVFDQTPLLVEVVVEFSRLFSAGSGRNDGCTSLRVSLVDDRVGVVALVGNDVGVVNAREQLLGLSYVVDLSLGEVEMNRIAEGVDTSVNLRGRSSSGTPDGLRPRFFSAPAAS